MIVARASAAGLGVEDAQSDDENNILKVVTIPPKKKVLIEKNHNRN